jgi:hypothetical protein
MNDLVKKFYWLIITTLVSLIILLLTNCVQDVTHFKFYNPFHSKYKEWENLEDSLLTSQKARYESHQKIHNYILTQKHYSKLFFKDCDNTASLADLRIKMDISIIDALIDSKKKQGLKTNEMDRLVKWQKTLSEELEFWNYIGEYSFKFLTDSTHFNASRFKYDYNLVRHKYIASYTTYFLYLGFNYQYWNPFLDIGKFLLKLYIYWLVILGIVYLMGKFLLPIGTEIWKEKVKNKPNKKT